MNKILSNLINNLSLIKGIENVFIFFKVGQIRIFVNQLENKNFNIYKIEYLPN
jgi:hypothetical protein